MVPGARPNLVYKSRLKWLVGRKSTMLAPSVHTSNTTHVSSCDQRVPTLCGSAAQDQTHRLNIYISTCDSVADLIHTLKHLLYNTIRTVRTLLVPLLQRCSIQQGRYVRSSTSVTSSSLSLLIVVGLLLALFVTPTYGGACWAGVARSGRCTELVQERVSREECCSASNNVATAYSDADLDAGSLFFWRVLGGGVACTTCKHTCVGVQCGEGRRCVQRKSGPRCVCAPVCRNGNGDVAGPVCGSDGRSYRSLCRLKKRACRRKTSALSVAYHGHCQSTCDKVRCGTGKHCVVDQNLSPHCVRCGVRSCSDSTTKPSRPVCGADGITYPSACHLREAACHSGRAIPVAYRGRCKRKLSGPHKGATCGNVRCRERQQCLSHMSTGAARCVTCGGQKCPRRARARAGQTAMPMVCGTNNRTYPSWCHMLKDACATGYTIDTQHSGPCVRTTSPLYTANHTIADIADNNS